MMANPILDIIHKQVLMTLYSLEVSGRLNDYRELLPVYLGAKWPECKAILEAIEKAGLLKRTETGIELTYKLKSGHALDSCGCFA